jgi:hypothetical protein
MNEKHIKIEGSKYELLKCPTSLGFSSLGHFISHGVISLKASFESVTGLMDFSHSIRATCFL